MNLFRGPARLEIERPEADEAPVERELAPQTDQRRFYDVLWPHAPGVLRTAHILCGGNSAEAEDLAQETMLKAFRAMDQFREGTDARAWLLTILRRTQVDRIRAAAPASKTVSLDDLPEDPADQTLGTGGPDRQSVVEDPQILLEEFSDRQVIEALSRLPEEIRWTLLLVDVEGLDHKEAAEVLNVPFGTIKSRAHRGRMMLREALLPVAREVR